MPSDRQACFLVTACRRINELPIDIRQLASVDSDLDEARSDAGAVDAICPFLGPASSQLIGAFVQRVLRQVLSFAGTVIASVRNQGDARCFCEPLEQLGITSKIGGRALGNRLTAGSSRLLQLW